jgi:hypothetical protein
MQMWRFVLRENIAHLRLLIAALPDHSRATQLQDQLREAERQLAEIDELSAHAGAAHDIAFAEMLTEVLRFELEVDAANFGMVQLLEASSGVLHIAAQLNFHIQFLRHFEVVHPGDGSIYGKALADGDGVWVEDIETVRRLCVAAIDCVGRRVQGGEIAPAIEVLGGNAWNAVPALRSAAKLVGRAPVTRPGQGP